MVDFFWGTGQRRLPPLPPVPRPCPADVVGTDDARSEGRVGNRKE